MKLSDFDFDLPQELIAQEPSKKRDESNILIPSAVIMENSVVGSGEKQPSIEKFYEIIDYLQAGDLLVFNDSRVINAQLSLHKNSSIINVNLNKPLRDNIWLGFAKPGKKLKIGDEFIFGKHKIYIHNKHESGDIEFEFILDKIDIFTFLDIYGEVPLPQYIKREEQNPEDLERYQTVYGKNKGSVAAATAGLHFTQDLLDKIQEKGIETAFVTLHVGAGTFLPVKSEDISEHKMHSEWCQISEEVAGKINKAKEEGRRVIIVGTTAMRTVESCAVKGVEGGKVEAKIMNTDIFITPGYKFQIADMLITNFHLPKSTLFMLVCAFAGYDEMFKLYRFAIDNRMRFFSYGDAMLLKKSE